MKVFVSQLFHEASSFVPNKVTTDSFRKRHYLRGFESVRKRFENDIDWVSGALEPFINNGSDISIGVCTGCNPAGVIEKASFIEIVDDMINEYRKYVETEGPPDVLMLLLHGANAVEDFPDPDGYLVDLFRSISENTVIGVTLDFHANISQKLVSSADIVIVGILYPHVDTYERAKIASNLSISKFNEKSDLKSYKFPIPILTSLPKQATVEDLPFHRLIKQVENIRRELNIVDLCIAGGFAFGDCYDVGMNLVAINVDYDVCLKAYKKILEIVWDLKDELTSDVPTLETAWPRIEAAASVGKVVVADVSDSPGSGGNADETHLLAKLLKSSKPFVSAFHVDPSVVNEAEKIGLGKTGEFLFGSSLSHPQSQTLQVKAKVEKILNYKYTNVGPMMHGALLNGGPTAILQVPNGLIIVVSERIQAYDINAFLNIGIDIIKDQALIIAIKSTAHFRASYTAIADQGIELVRCSGWSDIDFKSFDYKHRRKPLIPLETFDKSQWNDFINTAK